MARAIVNKPLVLLLDEPLSALDYRLRQEMELELKRVHRQLGITFVFVTHDQEEAISMSDRIAVMNQGAIEQIGTPIQIYEEPENMFVAKFVGEINVFDAFVREVNNGSAVVDIHGRLFPVQNRRNFGSGSLVKVLLRPEDIQVTVEEEWSGSDPSLTGRVDEVIYKGKTVDLIISLDEGESIFVTQFFNEDQENIVYREGQRVHVNWLYGWEVVL
jgi:spermidine/putrescine transport system ATP-binding protein